jgi:hypothetical protein
VGLVVGLGEEVAGPGVRLGVDVGLGLAVALRVAVELGTGVTVKVGVTVGSGVSVGTGVRDGVRLGAAVGGRVDVVPSTGTGTGVWLTRVRAVRSAVDVGLLSTAARSEGVPDGLGLGTRSLERRTTISPANSILTRATMLTMDQVGGARCASLRRREAAEPGRISSPARAALYHRHAGQSPPRQTLSWWRGSMARGGRGA